MARALDVLITDAGPAGHESSSRPFGHSLGCLEVEADRLGHWLARIRDAVV